MVIADYISVSSAVFALVRSISTPLNSVYAISASVELHSVMNDWSLVNVYNIQNTFDNSVADDTYVGRVGEARVVFKHQ